MSEFDKARELITGFTDAHIERALTAAKNPQHDALDRSTQVSLGFFSCGHDGEPVKKYF